MASYTVNAGERAVHEKTLVANTVDTVTFADDVGRVEIVSNGSAALYVRVDGGTPVVAGAYAYVLPAGGGSAREIDSSFADRDAAGGTVVKLISVGTPTYSVGRVTA